MSKAPTTPRWRAFVRQKPVAFVSSLALTLAVGVLDYLTGRDILILPFYLLPICWMSWVVGRRAGLGLSVLGTVAWLAGDMALGYAYPHRAIPYWNALMLFVVFAVVVYLLTAFHHAHAYLEATVAERTKLLRQEMAERERLEAVTIQMERLAAVGSMAAKLAHEIRNPLGTIKLNLDLLGDEVGALGPGSSTTTDEAKTLLKAVVSEACRMQSLAEDYLQFSRQPKLNRERVMLNELLARELEFLAPTLNAAHVAVTIQLNPALPAIQADPDQLWQAVLNLIRNAMEAMPHGGTLTLRTASAAGEVMLQVTDNGKGMSNEERAQVFKPFFTTKPSGTGLGLTLVQQIIFEHGGRIECASTAGTGTTFSLCFPLVTKPPTQHAS